MSYEVREMVGRRAKLSQFNVQGYPWSVSVLGLVVRLPSEHDWSGVVRVSWALRALKLAT